MGLGLYIHICSGRYDLVNILLLQMVEHIIFFVLNLIGIDIFLLKFVSDVDTYNLESLTIRLHSYTLHLWNNILKLALIIASVVLCNFVRPAVFYKEAQTGVTLFRYFENLPNHGLQSTILHAGPGACTSVVRYGSV